MAQSFIPEENIAVQFPIIVVRGTTAMRLSGAKYSANLHDAGSMMITNIGIFPFVGIQIGIQVLQFLGGYKRYIGVQLGVQLRIANLKTVVGIADGSDNGPNDQLQII